jgi:hypothetical protein
LGRRRDVPAEPRGPGTRVGRGGPFLRPFLNAQEFRTKCHA